MNMIEKVARALCKEYGTDKGVNWDNSEFFFKGIARVSIHAMREPTEEMRKVCDFEVAEVQYLAMIDAALKE